MSGQSKRCKARRPRTGEQCRAWAMAGQEVCVSHGGNAPQNRRAAQRRLADARAHKALSREGIEPIGNPLEELRQLAGEVVRLKDYLGGRVVALEELRYKTGAGEQVRAELAAYERALDRSVRTLAEIARLNIDERLAVINAHLMRDYVDASFGTLRWAVQLLTGGDGELVMEVTGWLLGDEQVKAVIDRALDGSSSTSVVSFTLPDPPEPVAGKVAAFRSRWESAERVVELERELDEARVQLARVRAGLAPPRAIESGPAESVVTLDDALAGDLPAVEEPEVVDAEIVDEPPSPSSYYEPRQRYLEPPMGMARGRLDNGR